jgi:hypothetical protein
MNGYFTNNTNDGGDDFLYPLPYNCHRTTVVGHNQIGSMPYGTGKINERNDNEAMNHSPTPSHTLRLYISLQSCLLEFRHLRLLYHIHMR